VIEPANAAFRRGDDALGAALMTGGIHSARGPAPVARQLQRRLQSALAMRMLALSSNEFPLLPPDAAGGAADAGAAAQRPADAGHPCRGVPQRVRGHAAGHGGACGRRRPRRQP
jgi:hypothetical protein